MNIGINLHAIKDYSTAIPFANIMLGSKYPWVSQSPGKTNPWNDQRPIAIGANGWPSSLLDNQVAVTQVFTNLSGHYPLGKYQIKSVGYEGEVLQGNTVVRFNSSAPTSEPIDLTSANNNALTIRITKITANNPSVSIFLPGAGGLTLFNPTYVKILRGFKGCLRFMDWQQTNNSPNQSYPWTQIDAPQMGDSGVNLEYAIALSNELGASPWFCIPHQATHDYCDTLAAALVNNLSHDQPVYVEYSNEIWNSIFTQYKWLIENQGTMTLPQFAAARCMEVWKPFKDAGLNIRRVCPGHAGTNFADQVGKGIVALGGSFDAIECGGYIGIDQDYANAHWSAATTAQEVIDHAMSNLYGRTLPTLRQHKTWGDQYATRFGRRVELVVYEGGPGFRCKGKTWAKACIDAQEHPDMQRLIESLKNEAGIIGVDLFNIFQDVRPWNEDGIWGVRQYVADDTLKYRTFIA
jgi:hypothetical protein